MHLMEMIMKGDSSSGVDETKCAAFNITQLVYFNFLRHRRSNYLLNIRHLQKKEYLLPTATGLVIQSKTRNELFLQEKFSISYNRCIVKQAP